MSRNFLLGILAAGALIAVVALIYFQPQEKQNFITQQSMKPQKKEQSLQVVYYQTKKEHNITKRHTQRKRRIDPTIKASAIDHYHTYLIQLIDKNPRDIEIENSPDAYVYVEGKISGKDYVMRIPRIIAERADIKLRITNLKTKKTKEMDASFLLEAASLPVGGVLRANIDFNNPDNIETDVKLPEENPPFPTLR